MTDHILIAAWSGRMLAASARRAGLSPLVVDAFGDDDTRALAAGFEHLPGAFPRGFEIASLTAALERLQAKAGAEPIGIVLGSGFEPAPDVVKHLARRWPLLGCGAETIRRAKDPSLFFPLLRDLGIAHPETRLDPPDDPAGWLVRRTGGSGGTHIRAAKPGDTAKPGVYFQRRLIGQPVSLSGVVGRGGAALAFTRQWTAPGERQPFRFGGAAGPATLDPDLEARMIEDALSLTKALGLVGLVSFDFLSVDGAPVLLEVNPRPSATLDILDDANGSLLAAHIAAFTASERVAAAIAGVRMREGAHAFGYVYADAGSVRVPAGFAWPEWTADRTPGGSVVPAGAPLATVIAAAQSPQAAARLVAERSRALETMLYPEQNTRQKTSEEAP